MTPQWIEEVVAGIDYHLLKIYELSAKLSEMKVHFELLRSAQDNSLRAEFEKMRVQMDAMLVELQKRGLPSASQYEATYQSIKSQVESPEWPMAIEQEYICDTPQKAMERASNILGLIVGESLKDRKFLDYGCGEGYVADAAQQRGATAYGYDISLENKKSQLVTDAKDFIKHHAPYDTILCYDVLDHILKVNPIQALLEMKSLLSPEGKLYVRCHPWSARHGGHLYTQANKAFLHLVMDEVELMRSGGYKSDYNLRVVRPLETYRYWFKEAGLSVKCEIPNVTDVEDHYFSPSPARERILKYWDGDEMAARENMKYDFVEYILQHPPRDGA